MGSRRGRDLTPVRWAEEAREWERIRRRRRIVDFATLVLGIAAAAFVLLAIAQPADAACADPFAGNEPNVTRSATGVEIDWYFDVTPGCTVDVRAEAHRDVTTNPDDVRSIIHRRSGTLVGLTSAGGQHVVNVLVTTSQPVRVILFADGRLYRIIDVDPRTIH